MISNWLIRWLVCLFLMLGCTMTETPSKKSAPQSLITTPTSYYSTPKARYLGGKYKENLDHLVDRISRSPKTSNLQFANNIAAVGGIGFFTHSAAKTADERYLEVIVGAPETFETKSNYSAKISRLFSLYGMELLSLLSSDSEISQEKELSGYGLNFSWRNVVPESSGPRVSLERAVAYLSKEKVKEFLRREIDQDKLLKEAVIFAVEEDGPMNLVSFRPQEINQDFRPPIREESLSIAKAETKLQPTPSSSTSSLSEKNEPAQVKKVGDNRDEPMMVQDKSEGKRESTASAPRAGKPNPESGPAPVTQSTNQEKSAGQKFNEASKQGPSSSTKTSEPKSSDQVIAIQKTAEVGKQPLNVEAKKTTEPMPTERNVQVTSAEATPASEDPSAGEPLVLTKNIPVSKAVAPSKPKTLEGYIIQLAFGDRGTAQRWAETLEHRGYTVSVTETASAGSLRVRIGNFALREEAERQLRTLRHEGVNGIVLNLPQAYRPEGRWPRVEENAKDDSITQ
jgi:cell division protein FtsN